MPEPEDDSQSSIDTSTSTSSKSSEEQDLAPPTRRELPFVKKWETIPEWTLILCFIPYFTMTAKQVPGVNILVAIWTLFDTAAGFVEAGLHAREARNKRLERSANAAKAVIVFAASFEAAMSLIPQNPVNLGTPITDALNKWLSNMGLHVPLGGPFIVVFADIIIDVVVEILLIHYKKNTDMGWFEATCDDFMDIAAALQKTPGDPHLLATYEALQDDLLVWLRLHLNTAKEPLNDKALKLLDKLVEAESKLAQLAQKFTNFKNTKDSYQYNLTQKTNDEKRFKQIKNKCQQELGLWVISFFAHSLALVGLPAIAYSATAATHTALYVGIITLTTAAFLMLFKMYYENALDAPEPSKAPAPNDDFTHPHDAVLDGG